MGATNLSGRLARWRFCLSEFDFSIEYRKEYKNQMAYAISRVPTSGETSYEVGFELSTLALEQYGPRN